ncbi:hypothetical protein DY000_02047457 [Brassica cretica]|uniref:Uncharacterized protein n=1 Tax=Brassica cretica TaxID=69181 RepID=A0ABQ7F1A1_BRACR|nr:hypothetical protein DY000_02047457 [Brassica cretica]
MSGFGPVNAGRRRRRAPASSSPRGPVVTDQLRARGYSSPRHSPRVIRCRALSSDVRAGELSRVSTISVRPSSKLSLRARG